MQADLQNELFEAAERKAREVIYHHRNYPQIDEVHIIAARASHRMEHFGGAVKYARVIAEEFPTSPFREEALYLIADGYYRTGQYYQSAESFSELLSSPIGEDLQQRSLSVLRDLSQDKLSAGELQRLLRSYPGSPLTQEMSLTIAKKEFARGDYDQAYALLADYLYRYPNAKDTPEVRDLIKRAASRRGDPDRRIDYLDPFKLGIVLPLTGTYSRYGRYLEQGMALALEDYKSTNATPITVVKADSKGDPIDAVKAVRKLVLEEGVLAIMGSVFTVPSVALAVEANAWKVPLLSPVVASERLVEIGRWVFQTRVPTEVEITAIVRVAAEDLHLQKYAVLTLASDEQQGLVDFFRREIVQRGGDIVAEEYYNEGDTDFKEQLEAIGEAAPEALFMPGAPDDLMNILPQISFYDLHLQLLGLSSWNSEKLLRISRQAMEGAIFPRETYHGRVRNTYQHFLSRYGAAYGGEVHPVAIAGYFGLRLLLQATIAGAIDRDRMREYLYEELGGSAERRMAEADALGILRVNDGKVKEFTAAASQR
jgi:branched-chain amino acid transport system substrate-binding protein